MRSQMVVAKHISIMCVAARVERNDTMENIAIGAKKKGNSILNSAKYSSSNTDEWYTTYETIADELVHYHSQFKGKVVLCNCDDPFESNFTYYFLRHFNQLQLKKLICTSYVGSKIDQIHDNSQLQMTDAGEPLSVGQGYVLIVSKVPGDPSEEVNDETIRAVLERKGAVKRLKGSGDFRSDECIVLSFGDTNDERIEEAVL